MDKKTLLQKLEALSRKTNEEWISGLEERKLKELDFHNKHRDTKKTNQLSKDTYEKLYGNKKFYGTVKLSSDYINSWIKQHSKDKIFLDYACGDGSNAIKAAKAGAELAIGLDISDISISNAKKNAGQEGVTANTYFLQGDCEATGLPDECIDVIVCSGMLHHLDLSYAFCELRRILKRNGVVLVVEALDYNPIIKIYRYLTPQMRTEWEKSHILSYKDINFGQRFFDIRNVQHWHLCSIIGAYRPFALHFLNMADRVLLKLPLLKMMSWIFTFEMHKKP